MTVISSKNNYLLKEKEKLNLKKYAALHYIYRIEGTRRIDCGSYTEEETSTQRYLLEDAELSYRSFSSRDFIPRGYVI